MMRATIPSSLITLVRCAALIAVTSSLAVAEDAYQLKVADKRS